MNNFSWNNLINTFLQPEMQDVLKNFQNINKNINNSVNNFTKEATPRVQTANTQSAYQFNGTAAPQNNASAASHMMGEMLLGAEVNQLEAQQTTQMLKELFQLPKDVTEFLKLAANQGKNNPINNLLSVILDVNQFSSILQQNGRNALSNLYQIIAEYNRLGVSVKGQEITELAKLINTSIRQATSTDAQAIKTIMLLYLPWLPLTDAEAFKIEISQKKEESVGDSEDSITLLITTVNYYNVRATIAKTGDDSVNVSVICAEEFPSKDLKEGLEEKSVKFNVPINFEASIQENMPKEKNEERKMKIFMNTSPGVNPFLLLIANSVLNIVHKIDDMNSLREKRSRSI